MKRCVKGSVFFFLSKTNLIFEFLKLVLILELLILLNF
jgi:hypothetical protein